MAWRWLVAMNMLRYRSKWLGQKSIFGVNGLGRRGLFTFYAALLRERNAYCPLRDAPLGKLGNQKFRVPGVASGPARRVGFCRGVWLIFRAFKKVIVGPIDQRVVIREEGQQLYLRKRCSHLLGKLTTQMSDARYARSVIKTIDILLASQRMREDPWAFWNQQFSAIMVHATWVDKWDISDGADDLLRQSNKYQLTESQCLFLQEVASVARSDVLRERFFLGEA